MKQLLQDNRTGEIAVVDVPEPIGGAGKILVRNRASLISLGTERSLILLGRKNLVGKARQRPDLVRRFVEKARQEGLGKTFQEAMGRLDTSRALGYSSAGTVSAAGPGVTSVGAGDRVACIGAGYAAHAETVLMTPNLCCRLPENVSFEQASFGMLGIIALHSVRAARVAFGETVVVVGLGLIGLLAAQIASAYGLRVFGYDLDARKIHIAAQLGLEARAGDWASFVGLVGQATAGRGADAVLLAVASSDAGPVDRGIRLLRRGGRLVLVGVADIHPDRQELWEREAEIVVSQAGGPGSLDPAYEEHGIDYPFANVRWTQKRNLEEFLRLVGAGRVDVMPLVTHRCGIVDAAAAYERLVDGTAKQLTIGTLIGYDAAARPLTTLPVGQPTARYTTVAGALAMAVCGAGTFARALLLPALRRTRGVALHTLVTERGGEASHVARRFGFELHSTDYDSVVADPSIDAVVIAAPHRLHAEMVIKALAAGKHVFVEKPLCVDVAQVAQVRDLYMDLPAAERPYLTVGYNRRHSRHAAWIKQQLTPRATPLVAHYRVTPGYLAPNHWVNHPAEGGGRIIGEACHFVDMLMYLTDSSPIRVYAERIPDSGEAAVPNDNFVATLRFADGSVGSLVYAAVGDRGHSREWLEVFADGKSVALRDYYRSQVHHHGRTRRFRTRGQDMGYDRELSHFVAVVRGEQAVEPDAAEGLFRSTLATIFLAQAVRTGLTCELAS